MKHLDQDAGLVERRQELDDVEARLVPTGGQLEGAEAGTPVEGRKARREAQVEANLPGQAITHLACHFVVDAEQGRALHIEPVLLIAHDCVRLRLHARYPDSHRRAYAVSDWLSLGILC